jgi:2-C-methyl-D-erythritol 4-phosphate cytidylyltransferase/2-C-methyl-D-erythritol 2,4-cyclodiphosphate synthase
MTNYALITAAGVGKRMQSQMNKIFLLLDEDPIIAKAIRKFHDCKAIDKIILISREEDKEELKKIVEKNNFNKVEKIVLGGEKRQNSVYNGLISLNDAKSEDIVLIHNGANPFVDEKTILDSIDAAKKYEAAVVGFKARDTIKEADDKGFVAKTLERNKLWQVQTPQTIRYGTAIKAFKKAFDENFFGTDDTMLVERLGKKVKIVECPYENIKITLPNDLEFANKLLKNSRIGFGMDSHRFAEDEEKRMVLAGVEIEGEKGFKANSDGDIILHALFNAISQGLGERSISHYADSMCENGIKDSREYLKVILKIMEERGYAIGNVGIMCEGKRPNISQNEEKLKESLSQILSLDKKQIGITATSGEELSAFGKGVGMQCFCVVTLNKR